MVIKSNTLGKLQKIRNGNVFDSPLIFLRELLQNSQRSLSKNVEFYLDGDTLICRDDGCGCSNPDNVFTLDLSDWESTSEGYGIGFWSCLAIPDVSMITVTSSTWKCYFDAQKLFETGDLSVTQEKVEKKKGFFVSFKSPWFIDQANEISAYLFEIAKYLPMNVSIDEMPVPRCSIFDSIEYNYFTKEYNNRYFRAKLGVNSEYYNPCRLYYEHRFVCEMSVPYVCGVFEIKEGALTLKEPDRTSYCRHDEKYKLFMAKVEECATDLYKQYVLSSGVDDEDFSSAILEWCPLKFYEKFLDFDDWMFQKFEKEAPPKEKEEPVASVDAIVDTSIFERKDSTVTQSFITAAKITAIETPRLVSDTSSPKQSFKDRIKHMRRSVWVKKSEYDCYKSEIQKAKYKGLNVIIAKNELYSNALKNYGIVHISHLEDYFKEYYIYERVELKDGKEEAFISLLTPICKKYGLASDTFLICDLSINSSFVIDGEVVFSRKLRNKKGRIQINGATDRRHIYLDRCALGLNRFNLRKGNPIIGVWEIKALMANVNTIAHEMAHMLKDTTDNTPEHYQAEVGYQQDIIRLYV